MARSLWLGAYMARSWLGAGWGGGGYRVPALSCDICEQQPREDGVGSSQGILTRDGPRSSQPPSPCSRPPCSSIPSDLVSPTSGPHPLLEIGQPAGATRLFLDLSAWRRAHVRCALVAHALHTSQLTTLNSSCESRVLPWSCLSGCTLHGAHTTGSEICFFGAYLL